MPVSSACRRSPALAPALTGAAPGYVLRLSVEPLLRTRAAMRDRRVFPLQDRKTYNVPLQNPPYRRTRESAGHFNVPSGTTPSTAVRRRSIVILRRYEKSEALGALTVRCGAGPD